jgi:hypothetical protein
VSDTIEATTGPDGQVKCAFDGEALELTGVTASVLHLPVNTLNVKKKKKPDKDGGQVYYYVTPLLSSRVELYTRPDDIAGMEALNAALLAAGAKKI